MANNHVLDYGPAGLADTLAAARAGRFPYVGIGANAATAWAPYLTTIHGVKIAVIGVSHVAGTIHPRGCLRHRPAGR
jgi:poly-gamma-glutamate synthesis protein (capsule biosynthesis protein)